MHVHFLVLIGALKRRDCRRKNFPIRGLATASRSNNHETVTYLDSVVKLDDLCHKAIYALQILCNTSSFDARNKLAIDLLWARHTWEQIEDNVLEQRQIIGQELGHIDISESTKQKLILVHVRVL